MEDLKPCPFCGPEQSVVAVYEDIMGYWGVGCGRCGSHSGKLPKHDPEARAKVISLWNSRPMDEANKKDLLFVAQLLEYCDAMSGERICDDPYPEWLEPYSKEELVSMNTEFHQFNGDPEESYERGGMPLTLNASGYAYLFAKRFRKLLAD